MVKCYCWPTVKFISGAGSIIITPPFRLDCHLNYSPRCFMTTQLHYSQRRESFFRWPVSTQMLQLQLHRTVAVIFNRKIQKNQLISVLSLREYFRPAWFETLRVLLMVSMGFFPNWVQHLCRYTHMGSFLTEEHPYKYLIYNKSVHICQLQR